MSMSDTSDAAIFNAAIDTTRAITFDRCLKIVREHRDAASAKGDASAVVWLEAVNRQITEESAR